jgi:hypothetical protein
MNGNIKLTVLLLTLSACGLSTAPEDQEVVDLRVGEEYVIPGTVLRVGFSGVDEDSRCPVDVVCVWEGNAAVELGLTTGTGPTRLRILNTALEPQATDFEGVRVTLVAVSPEPREGEPIPAESYVVRLRLEAVPD